MRRTVIRIQSIELENFKNIKNGYIDFLSYKQKEYYNNRSEIIGLYGQNGSGKTAVIEAFNLFKTIVSGEKLPDSAKDYIHEQENKTVLKFVLYIARGDEKFLVHYQFAIRRKDDQAELSNEKLSYSEINDESKKRKADIIEYNIDKKGIPLLPKIRYNELTKNNKEKGVILELEVCKRMSIKEKTSFIFNENLEEIFDKNFANTDHSNIILALKHFAKINLYIITNQHSAPISLNIMPLNFRMENTNSITCGNIGIVLSDISYMNKKEYDIAIKIIEQLNIVLNTIIPNLQLEIKDLGKEISKEGEEVNKIELLSIRKNIKIPLKYESEGIKKIISILSTLISMFNNPSICLIVDELDAGIFEYLLGELLKIIEQNGKGQFIFTSHNLRALETLNKDSLVFSTSNPKNRFIRFTNIKSNNNLRNVYLRGVDLGGLSECIYEETNSFEIAHAFRKAGEIFGKN